MTPRQKEGLLAIGGILSLVLFAVVGHVAGLFL